MKERDNDIYQFRNAQNIGMPPHAFLFSSIKIISAGKNIPCGSKQ